jgi:hypothetical protein
MKYVLYDILQRAFSSPFAQIITNEIPFYVLSDDELKRRVIAEKERPGHPDGLSDSLSRVWTLMVTCWDPNPSERPSFQYIAETLPKLAAGKL